MRARVEMGGPSNAVPVGSAVTIVVATRDRAGELARTLQHLRALPGAPPLVVVDNGSSDATAEVASFVPGTRVVCAGTNLGAAGRNLGALVARTPYVAFVDDDSWFEAGALEEAVRIFHRCPSVALVAGAVMVHGRDLDPTCGEMACSPLDAPAGAPAGVRRVLGFLACGAVVRRRPFLSVGGFAPWLHIGAEEELLCLDLAAAGWDCAYAPGVVAHHFPSPARDPLARARLQVRNSLWVAWARLGPGPAVRRALSYARRGRGAPGALGGIAAALAGLPGITPYQRRAPAGVVHDTYRLASERSCSTSITW